MPRFRLNSDGLGALSRLRSETTRVVPSLLESWASWLLVPSAASTLDPSALDVAISCLKETSGRVQHQPRRRAQLLPIIPELFSIPDRTYYSQNYSGIISASLKTGHGWTAKCRRFPTKIPPSARQCAYPGNFNFNNNFPGARAAAVQFLPETT